MKFIILYFVTIGSICSEDVIKGINVKIGTHNGEFHCDDALACFMLQQLPEYENAEIVRTRNKTLLAECDIVVDVGGVFDTATKRFDHHQKTFDHTLSSLRPELGDEFNIKLCSAGLIYTFYGEKIIKLILKKYKNIEIESEALKIIYKKIYKNFIEEIDAIDNGIPMYDTEPRYTISTHISVRVKKFYPVWNSNDSVDYDGQFEKAKLFVGNELLESIFYYASVWWPARSVVQNAIENRFLVHKSGEILVLSKDCPWRSHLFDLEMENKIIGITKFIIVQKRTRDWRVYAVPIKPDSLINRKFLLKKWRAVFEENAENDTGITGAIFVHSTGFTGGCKTKECAIEMAEKSLLDE